MYKKFMIQVVLNCFLLFIFFSCEKNSTESSLTVPEVLTNEPTSITHTSVQSGGIITSDGGAFITDRGVCWNATQEPTIANDKTSDGNGAGSFTSNINGLLSGTLYYIRAYAINSVGTGYGSTISFSTREEAQTETITDIDGNTYRTIKIGNQWWMAENLKVTRYCNGDIIKIGNQWWKADNLKVTHYLSDDTIPNVTDPSIWANLTIGAYCNYNNDDSNADIYGSLYNWNMVNDCRSIAPVGWHVPTNEEWQILVDYCGGDNIAGGKLKETGTIHWENPNTNATNKSCFSALPGGYRDKNGNFCNMSKNAYFWSSTEHDSSFALYRQLKYDDSKVFRFYHNKQYGFSVRCVKD